MKQLCYGEFLWDIIEGNEHIGGAPFNYASHSVKLGGEACLASAVGRDSLGRRALDVARRNGVSDRLIKVNNQPTGTVPVMLDERGVPDFAIEFPAAWDYIELSGEDMDWIDAQGFDCLYFGCLVLRSPASRRTLESLVSRSSFGHTFCDINFRQRYYDRERVEFCLNTCSILKMNDGEALEIGRLLEIGGDEERVCQMVRETYGVQTVCITAGPEGCRVYAESPPLKVPGREVEVADTVGAGDAFAAGFMKKIGDGASLEEAATFAARLGELVASKNGAVPEYDPDEIEAG